MSNYYFLKLHFDMLDDWKVGTLPDGLKWRFIQCLLVAGEQQEDGFLPPLNQFAFRIRPMTPEQLQADLSRLAAAELVELRLYEDGSERWFVSNFKKRQAKIDAAQRKRDQRERDRKRAANEYDTEQSRSSHEDVTSRDGNAANGALPLESHDSVTTRDTEVEVDIEVDKKRVEVEVDLPQLAALFTELTTFIPPHNSTDEYNDNWLIPLRQIESMGQGDTRMREAVQILRKKNYKIVSPRSLVTTAGNWQPPKLSEHQQQQSKHLSGAW